MRRMNVTGMVLASISVIDLLVFSNAGPLMIFAMAVGTALMFVGLITFYRPSSVVGLLLVTITAATGIQIDTLTDFSNMMTAIFGLLVPSSLLTWIALAPEEQEYASGRRLDRSLVLASAAMLACLWSVPLMSVAVGIFMPEIAMRMTLVTEVSAILVSAAVIGSIVTFLTEKSLRAKSSSTESAQ